ncbi:MAG TPA: hypothetical protein VL727_29145 [Puia sp.]|jgi:hypothetical protein|nr:hypothetical protein [Puia sp.]
MENLTLKVENASGEIVIREGEAVPVKPPQKVRLIGNISSVKEFLDKRTAINGSVLQKLDKQSAVIVVDEDHLTISLYLDPENADGTEIIGKLEFTEYLSQFKINGSETFTQAQLVKILRFSKQLFETPDKHEALLRAYQSFDFSVAIKAASEQDQRGNKSGSLQKIITTNLPQDFILYLPVFKGKPRESFRVEICYDTTDASIRFWFESPELKALIDQRKIEIFEEELKDYKDYVIIRK